MFTTLIAGFSFLLLWAVPYLYITYLMLGNIEEPLSKPKP